MPRVAFFRQLVTCLFFPPHTICFFSVFHLACAHICLCLHAVENAILIQKSGFLFSSACSILPVIFVTFVSLWPSCLTGKIYGRKLMYFGSLFHRAQPMVAWLCAFGQDIMKMGVCGCSSPLFGKWEKMNVDAQPAFSITHFYCLGPSPQHGNQHLGWAFLL